MLLPLALLSTTIPLLSCEAQEDPIVGQELAFRFSMYNSMNVVEAGEKYENYMEVSFVLHMRIEDIAKDSVLVKYWISDAEVSMRDKSKEEAIKKQLEGFERREEIPINSIAALVQSAGSSLEDLLQSVGVGKLDKFYVELEEFRGLPALYVEAVYDGPIDLEGYRASLNMKLAAYYDTLLGLPLNVEFKQLVKIDDSSKDAHGNAELRISMKLVKGLEVLSMSTNAERLNLRFRKGDVSIAFTSRDAKLSNVNVKDNTIEFDICGKGIGSLVIVLPQGIEVERVLIDGEPLDLQIVTTAGGKIVAMASFSMSRHTVSIVFVDTISSVSGAGVREVKTISEAIAKEKTLASTGTRRVVKPRTTTPIEGMEEKAEETPISESIVESTVSSGNEQILTLPIKQLLNPTTIALIVLTIVVIVLGIALIRRR